MERREEACIPKLPVGTVLRAILSAILLTGMAGAGPAQDKCATPEGNPEDNITRTKVILRHDRLDRGDRSESLTLKCDRAFGQKCGADIEPSFVPFKGLGLQTQSLGDIQARVREPSGPTLHQGAAGPLLERLVLLP